MTEVSAAERQFRGRGRLVFVVIGILVGIEGLRHLLPQAASDSLVLTFAFVPANVAQFVSPAGVLRSASEIAASGVATSSDLAQLLGQGTLRWWTPVTYALLHGSWTHCLINCFWLAAFGSAVARRFGAVRFLLFLAVTAIGGIVGHCVTHFYDFAPLVGASAAISGAMAAAVRFAFAPGAPLGPAGSRGRLESYQGPALPLRDILRDGRALAFLVTWFAANFLFGIVVSPVGLGDSSIAWEAHIGGFLTGLLLFRFFDPVHRPIMPPTEPPPVASPDAASPNS